MRSRLFLWLFFVVGLFEATAAAQPHSATTPSFSSVGESSDQSGTSSQFDDRVTIPGPLRSFLRMAGMRQNVSLPEVLPILARNMILHGYQTGRATEYLILLRHYFHQAKELSDLAGPDGNIRVGSCKEVEPLLRVLGYKTQGECGRSGMTLVTADPQRAFLTIDSGFPLLDLEEALQKASPFVCAYAGSAVPALFAPGDWTALTRESGKNDRDLVESLLYDVDLDRLYWALSRIDPETRAQLKKDIGLAKLLPFAPVLDFYGSQICIRAGAVVVPGGRSAEKEWQSLVGANPSTPAEFIPQLLKKDRGWLAAYFDAMARASQNQQEHFLAGQRLKRFYAAFRSSGTSSDAATSFAFRPAPALMVLVTRLQWGADGDPYVPGNLQVWSEILRQKANSRIIREWGKRSGGWRHPDQLAEAMFAFSRLEGDSGPLQAYLCLSELDHRRPPERRLSDQTVVLLAARFADFSDQYLIFSEFPELTDVSITRFLTTAEALNKISDHALRGNAMGTFQAAVGLWQILARQGQIDRTHLNSSWQEVIKPFNRFSTSAQLFTAGRRSIDEVFRAATGKAKTPQDEMINVLAGAPQRTAGGQRMRLDMANRIRSVLEDQRLVSLDTLFALDDGLNDLAQGINRKDTLIALAGELREFEMPRPIFTSGERSRWAAGTYNNRHTEGEMRTDLARVVSSPTSPRQREEARGQLATFLRDTLVGMNYAYYEPPGSQVLRHNPLFVRSHDFSGDTVIGVEQLWQSAQLFGAGSPAGGGAHLIGSLADLSYVLAEAEQDFIAPDHVQALIWKQFVPGLLSSAIVPRWWGVSENELHAAALYQRAAEELLAASSADTELRGKVMSVLSDRMFPARLVWLEQTIRTGRTKEMLDGIMPAEAFYLTAEFRQRFPSTINTVGASGRELEALSREKPEEVSRERLSRDFGIVHPVLAQSYAREFLNVKPFPALSGNYSRLMAECWDSGNLYWARLADEMGYSPVLLNRMVPELTRRMVERIFASELEDWSAILVALQETGEEFRQGKISFPAASTGKLVPETK
jgi:hypothetical protein